MKGRCNMVDYEGPRCIEEYELPELINLLNLVFRSDGGDMASDYPRHVAMSNRENVRIIKMGGKIVAHVATSVRPVNLSGIQTYEAGIGAVATHADARGLRLASVLMQDAVERSVEQGADIMLISGDLGVYRRMHAVDCGRFNQVKIDRTYVEASGDFSISPAQENHIDDIINLWSTLPTRYILPREDWIALFDCKTIMDKPSDWWVVHHDGNLCGMGIIKQEAAELTLQDWAGQTEALQAAASFWFDHYKNESLTYVPSSANLLPLNWKKASQGLRTLYEGTVLVIQAQRFLKRAEALIIERIGEQAFADLKIEAQEQSATFEYKGERLEFQNAGELTHLFFGHPEIDILSDRLPHDSPLYKIMSRIFPIPLVWYGVGYV